MSNYIRNSGKTVPNLLICVHNYSAFIEMCEDGAERMIALAREGIQYGMFFMITAFDPNAVRSRTAVNYRQIYVLQMNNEDAYYDILGKTGGLYPSAYPGRGIFKRNSITYEFQTDILFPNAPSAYDEVKKYVGGLSYTGQSSLQKEKEADICSSVTREEIFRIGDLHKIPVGVNQGRVVCLDLGKYVKYPIIMSDNTQFPVAEAIVESIQRVIPQVKIINQCHEVNQKLVSW